MDFQIAYWHWVVFGMLLMLAEIAVPSFTIFWFGLAGLLMGVLLILMPDIGISSQLVIWAVLSILFALAWFTLLRPLMKDRTKAGHAGEAVIGETGQVIRQPTEGMRGQVRFATPILGDDEWDFICDQDVNLGDRVAIKSLSGNTLIVEKRS